MEIGWIDFSRSDREKVLSVIDLLSEDGTLDELGISPIRNGFSDLFFPGTSTIQTRAKYFLIVPYALADLSHRPDLNPQTLFIRLDDIERQCGKILLTKNDDGVIGRIALRSNSWVKRAPSSIYWAGIRNFGIFTRGSMTISEYFKALNSLNKHRQVQARATASKDEEIMPDEPKTENTLNVSFWNLPPYPDNWMEDLAIELSPIEADFLKRQIILHQPASMLAFFLSHNLTHITQMKSFSDLLDNSIFTLFPEQMRQDYQLAEAFSSFVYGIRIRYNMMISKRKNDAANEAWDSFLLSITEHANLNIKSIFTRLQINNPGLQTFLLSIQQHMLSRDFSQLDNTIRQREIYLKGESRAKLNQAGHFPANQWFGEKKLDYRFDYAKRILQDIFQGLEEK